MNRSLIAPAAVSFAALGLTAIVTGGCANPVTPPMEFTCKANMAWQPTGIILHPGDRLTVQYENGQWTVDTRGGFAPPAGNPHTPGLPTDILPTADRSALIGRVGDSVFLIGNAFNDDAPAEGHLYCAINNNISTSDGAPFLRTEGAVTMRAWVTRKHPACTVQLPELCL